MNFNASLHHIFHIQCIINMTFSIIFFLGLHQLSFRTLWIGSPFKSKISHLGLQENVLHNRPLHCRHYLVQTTSKTHEITSTQKPKEHERKTEDENEDDEDDNRPEYIPKRKAKNPMMKIGYAW